METKTKLFLYFIGAIVSLSSIFQMGYSNAYPNTSIDQFKAYLNHSYTHRGGGYMSENTYSWLWSAILNVWFIGFALGSFVAIPVTDSLGRKKGLLFGNALTLISIAIMTISIIFDVFELLIVGRLISAFASGIAMCALILFLQEISPNEIRGSMGFYAELAFVVMNTVGAILGMSMFLGNHLPMLVGFAVIPSVISIIALIPLHETAKFLLIKHGNEGGAKESLQFYMNLNDEEVNDQLDAISDEAEESSGTIKTLLTTPHLRKGLLLGMFALQITCSIWPIIYYSTDFLRKANIDYDLAESFSSGMLIVSTVATVIGMLVMERFSRRKLFIFVSIINIFALILFVICSQLQPRIDSIKYGCIVAIFIHGTSYSFATGPVAWFITSELVPISYRALAQSIALGVNQLTALVLTFIVFPLYNIIDSWSLLILYIIPGIFALIYLWFNLPETKNRDIADVIEDIKNGKTSQPIKNKYEMAKISTNNTADGISDN
uniref:Major facilitator superfamily (MFS) profile domain-containing protein n=1 Tax=Panagrolaimus superbus TaxID=310955 RepID=A0A914ZAP4_9BILA